MALDHVCWWSATVGWAEEITWSSLPANLPSWSRFAHLLGSVDLSNSSGQISKVTWKQLAETSLFVLSFCQSGRLGSVAKNLTAVYPVLVWSFELPSCKSFYTISWIWVSRTTIGLSNVMSAFSSMSLAGWEAIHDTFVDQGQLSCLVQATKTAAGSELVIHIMFLFPLHCIFNYPQGGIYPKSGFHARFLGLGGGYY